MHGIRARVIHKKKSRDARRFTAKLGSSDDGAKGGRDTERWINQESTVINTVDPF